jgi:hypothetical protein
MFDLDLSIRVPSRVELDELVNITTEEDALMESLFDEPSSESKRDADDSLEDNERKRMRLIIEAAFEESGAVQTATAPAPLPPAPVHEEPKDIKEIWKNAGIFREYGGVKGWLAMQRAAPGSVQSGGDSGAR